MKRWIIFEAFRFCYELSASGALFRTGLESIPTPEGLRTFAQWRKCQRTMHQVGNLLQIQTILRVAPVFDNRSCKIQ